MNDASIESALGERITPSDPTVTFVPSQVEGLSDIESITVTSHEIIFYGVSQDQTFSFASIARRQESRLAQLLKLCLLRRPWPRLVANRSWCIEPSKAYFVFYTDPLTKIFMPSDDVADYATCCFTRIREVIHSGRYATIDLN